MVHAHPRALGNHGQGKRSRSSLLQEDLRGQQRFFSSFKLSVSCGFRAVMGSWSWSVNTGKYKAWMNQSLAGALLFLPPRLGGSVGLLGLKSGFLDGN